MGFLVPFIAPALVGTAGGALLGAGLSIAGSVGLGMIAKKLAPKQKASAALRGTQLSFQAETNQPRFVAFGMTSVEWSGRPPYWNLYGTNNDYLQLVYPLADCECESLEAVWVNGEPVTVNPDTTVDEYADAMWIEFHGGAWDQAADAELVEHGGGRWTADDRGRGVCYVRLTLKYSEAKYPGGIPRVRFQFKGAKLYDWRKDDSAGGSGAHRWGQPETYEHSANPVVAWYNWKRGIWVNGQRIAGMNTPASAIDHDDATAAANICDEQVALKAGGYETRYLIGGLLDTSQNHRSHIENILSCMAGEEYDLGGIFRIMAGAAQSPVLAMTDADILADAPVRHNMSHTADKLTNAFFGAYIEPEKNWNEEPLDPRLSAADETADGGDRLEARFDFPFINSNTQGQRVLEALRRQARRQQVITVPVRAGLSVLEAGDWIVWTSARYGWLSKTWQVQSASVSADDHSADLVLQEIDADVFSWVPAVDEITPGVTQPLPSGGPSLTTVSGLAVANATLTGVGGAQRPALRVTWTPITDQTVDGIKIQYRKAGETDAMTVIADDSAAGEFLCLTGIQGGVEYEVRAIPVTTPQRALIWTAWVQVPSAAPSHIVNASITTSGATPESNLEGELDRISDIRKDVLSQMDEAVTLAAAAAAVVAGNDFLERVKLKSRVGDSEASIVSESVARADGDTALAGDFIDLEAVVDDNTASIVSESVARSTADEALAMDITAVEVQADQATAGGYFKVEAIAAPSGVAARLAMFANAGTVGTPDWEEAGIYIDVVAGVGSQIFLKADKVKFGDGTSDVAPIIIEGGIARLNEMTFKKLTGYSGNLIIDGVNDGIEITT